LTPPAFAGERPYLYGCGRFTASWAERPQSYDVEIWDHMEKIGVTMTGTGLAWVDAEPEKGKYDWDVIKRADFEVDEIRKRGMEPTFFLGLTPKWAALHPNLPPHRTPAKEEFVKEFEDFHRFVAERYKGKVKYYFFWNEPNGCSWINDGCGNADGFPLYTKWLIRCSKVVKEADPEAKIIAGRLDYHAEVTSGIEYIQGMYDQGAGPWIDGIAIHPYNWKGGINWRALRETRETMVANGDADKPVWITEYGWNNGNEEEKAEWLREVMTELEKPEWGFVEHANYLVLNDGGGVENYGLTDADLHPRPAYHTFQELATEYAGIELPVYQCRRTPRDVDLSVSTSVTGLISAPPMTLVRVEDGAPAGKKTEVRAVWSDEYLYLRFDCEDDDIRGTLMERDDPVFEEDVVEVFLNPSGDLEIYYEIDVNPLNTVFDALILNPGDFARASLLTDWNPPGLATSVDVDGDAGPGGEADRGWSVTIAIPFEEMYTAPNRPPRPGDRWRWNLYRVDQGDGAGEFQAWSPTGGVDFHRSRYFGILEFTE
jgi:hypothetical protein